MKLVTNLPIIKNRMHLKQLFARMHIGDEVFIYRNASITFSFNPKVDEVDIGTIVEFLECGSSGKDSSAIICQECKGKVTVRVGNVLFKRQCGARYGPGDGNKTEFLYFILDVVNRYALEDNLFEL